MNLLNEEPFIIQSLQKEIEIQHLNKNIVTCLILLSDGRILTGHLGGGICIISINILTKEWNIDIIRNTETFHKRPQMIRKQWPVVALCELQSNIIVSVSGQFANQIKLWLLSQEEIIEVGVLEGHTDKITNILSLSDDTLVSSSYDKTIRIWNYKECKEEVILHEESEVHCIHKLQSKENVLVSGCNGYIGVWDNCSLVTRIQSGKDKVNHCIIEIMNGYLVVSQSYGNIIIIDYIKREIVKEIKDDIFCNDIHYFNLCTYDDYSFIALIGNKRLVQINTKDNEFNIIYKTDIQFGEIVVVKDKQYIITNNLAMGIDVYSSK